MLFVAPLIPLKKGGRKGGSTSQEKIKRRLSTLFRGLKNTRRHSHAVFFNNLHSCRWNEILIKIPLSQPNLPSGALLQTINLTRKTFCIIFAQIGGQPMFPSLYCFHKFISPPNCFVRSAGQEYIAVIGILNKSITFHQGEFCF